MLKHMYVLFYSEVPIIFLYIMIMLKLFCEPQEVSTLAGAGVAGDVDSTTSTSVRFDYPYFIDLYNNDQYLLVADYENSKIRRVTVATGATTTREYDIFLLIIVLFVGDYVCSVLSKLHHLSCLILSLHFLIIP